MGASHNKHRPHIKVGNYAEKEEVATPDGWWKAKQFIQLTRVEKSPVIMLSPID